MTGTIIRSYCDRWGKEEEGLLEALGLDRLFAPIVSVVGGGGKTSVIRRLALEYEKRGQPVIVTTTTKMKLPDTDLFLTKPDMELLAEMLREHRAVWIGSIQKEGKMGPLPMVFLEAVRLLQVPILIEADGANRRPCKVPAAHEPAIWGKSTVVIGVIGLEAIGQQIKAGCHRPELVAELLHKSENETLLREDVVTIALNGQGLKKATDPFMKYHIILNKADNERRALEGEKAVALFRENGFYNVLITANLMGKEGRIEEAYRAYAVVVLAAGKSSRFGSNKLLHLIHGKPMYEHMLEVLDTCADMTKVIVSGYPEIIEGARRRGVCVAENYEPELGISHSIMLGIKEARKRNPSLCGIVFAVCDQPDLSAASILKLTETAGLNRGKIICASKQGKSHNPVLWDKAYLDELCTLSGDVGGRQLLSKYSEQVIKVEIKEEELKDIDLKADLDAN